MSMLLRNRLRAIRQGLRCMHCGANGDYPDYLEGIQSCNRCASRSAPLTISQKVTVKVTPFHGKDLTYCGVKSYTDEDYHLVSLPIQGFLHNHPLRQDKHYDGSQGDVFFFSFPYHLLSSLEQSNAHYSHLLRKS